jgi:hypothetical protein
MTPVTQLIMVPSTQTLPLSIPKSAMPYGQIIRRIDRACHWLPPDLEKDLQLNADRILDQRSSARIQRHQP